MHEGELSVQVGLSRQASVTADSLHSGSPQLRCMVEGFLRMHAVGYSVCSHCLRTELTNHFSQCGLFHAFVPLEHTGAVRDMLNLTFRVGLEETTCTELLGGVSKRSSTFLGSCSHTKDINHDRIPAGMSKEVTAENEHCFVETQRRHRVALYECLKARMYDIIAECATNTKVSNEAPVYVFLRDSAVSEWTAYLVQEIWKSKIGLNPRYFSYRCDSFLTVDHFKALAFSFRMTYAGPATETGGADLSKFYRLDDEVLPFFSGNGWLVGWVGWLGWLGYVGWVGWVCWVAGLGGLG